MRRRWGWLVVVAFVVVSGCVSKQSGKHSGKQAGKPAGGQPAIRDRDSDGPPLHTPEWIASIPDPIPSPEPRSERGNPASYTVLGKTYHVADTADGYNVVGNASWYGKKFHGRSTSSGEPYDMYKLTAAHRTLPIPTYARVTRADTGRSIIVRINDRGPFHANRVIDLSYAAAVKLGIVESGTARVRVQTIYEEMPTQVALQVGAYSSLSAADRVANDLRARLKDLAIDVVKIDADDLFRVHVAGVLSAAARANVMSVLKSAGYGTPLQVPAVGQ